METEVKRNIALLWLAQIISSAGDAIYHIALMWLILDLTGSSLATGLVAMSATIPAMIFGLYSGVLADRLNRMGLMIFANISQAFTVCLIPVLILTHHQFALLFGVLAFTRATFGTLFPPALNAFIPEIVHKQYLVRVNSLLSTSQQVAWFAGPAVAGTILHYFSLSTLFFFDAASFLLAIILLLIVKVPRTKPQTVAGNNGWDELLKGIRYAYHHEFIGFLILLTVVNNFFIMGPALVGMPLLIRNSLQGSVSDYAFVESFMALGMLAGSLLVYLNDNHTKAGILLLLGMVLDGLTYSVFYSVQSIFLAWFLIFIHGIGIPMITISRTAMIQKYADQRYHGRLFSMVHLAVVGVTALSAAAIGAIAEIMEPRVIFLIIGILAASCGVAGWFHPHMRKQF